MGGDESVDGDLRTPSAFVSDEGGDDRMAIIMVVHTVLPPSHKAAKHALKCLDSAAPFECYACGQRRER